MAFLTRVQRRILALLEEAGEENVLALVNTVARPTGELADIRALQHAMLGLLEGGLVVIATSSDMILESCNTSFSEGVSLLNGVPDRTEWADDSRTWKWTKAVPLVEIRLTPRGEALAHQVLTEDGWPDQPLDSYC